MAFSSVFDFAPAEWLPLQDRELVDRMGQMQIEDLQGKNFENPDFEARVVYDVRNYFATDLFQRILMSDKEDKQLVIILPSPENQVFISVAENLNKFNVSCRNVQVFFLYEYANEKGDVAPWGSPYSRSGHFMRYFYNRVNPELRMPMENIHFWTKENVETYSDEIAAFGGADVAYTELSWSGSIGAIEYAGFPTDSMEEFLQMGSRYVTLELEHQAHDSLRGMFGCSGDIANVPPCAVTIGPKDIAAAKYRVDVEYLSACGGSPSLQLFPLKLALAGPIMPINPGSMLRLFPGICYIAESVAKSGLKRPDNPWLIDKLEEIRKQEEEA